MNFLQRLTNAATILFRGGEIPLQGVGAGYGNYDLGRLLFQGGSFINWAEEATPYYNNPVIAICSNKIATMIGESELIGQKWDAKKREWVEEENNLAINRLMQIVLKPNEFDTYAQVEFATAMALSIFGEAFWFVRRNQIGQPIGFRWVPNKRITPMSDQDNREGTKVITHYEYRPPGGNGPIDLPIEDVVFFRCGINPEDVRRGWSPVMQTVREIVLYNDTATRQAGLIRNPGAGRLLFPKISEKSQPTPDQVQKGVNVVNEMVRDRSGRSAMMPFEVGVAELSVDPSKLSLSNVSATALNMICAAFGGDPMAFGLPSESKTYANLGESLDALGKQTVLPLLANMAETITQFAQREFRLETNLYRLSYDNSDVSWLLDEIGQEQERHRENFKVGGMSVAAFKAKIGEEPMKGDESITYFDLLNQGRGLVLNSASSCDCGNKISDHAKNLVAKDKAFRERFNRPQTNAAPKTAKANLLQDRHDAIIRSANNKLLKIATRFFEGDMEELAFRNAYSQEIEKLHSELYALGIELAGQTPDPESVKQIGLMMRDFEQVYIQGLAQDIGSKRYDKVEGALSNRVQMYANKGSSSASRGFLDGSPEQDEFYWDMTVAEHCEDCPYLQASSPFLKETLYTTPRAGDTQCLSNCRCRLIRASDGQTGFGPI